MKKWSKEILFELMREGVMNFSEVRKMVGSPTTASKRLRELVDMGAVKREVQDDRFRSVSYSLTDKGERIAGLVKELEATIG